MSSGIARGHLLGIDIGGTFTDVVLAETDGWTRTEKVLTTTTDPVIGVMEGLATVLRDELPATIIRAVHATTLATNTILEGRGEPTALVTTEGFGDLALIGHEVRSGPDSFDLFFEKKILPVDPKLIFEIPERTTASGEILKPLDESAVETVAQEMLKERVSTIAICLLHSYANPKNEERVAALLRSALPNAYIAVSSRLWPQRREFDRLSTTILCAYVAPSIAGYIDRLQSEMEQAGVRCGLQIMQSGGGAATSSSLKDAPIHALESGPAAGVLAAAKLGQQSSELNVISFDMGGTTAKVGIILDGDPQLTSEFHIGDSVSAGEPGARSGFPVRIPVVDLVEIGSGGGSIAWIDQGGLLHVGPRSAGAHPGPACYDRGGHLPTVTDANLVLGFLDPRNLLGGTMALRLDKAREAIQSGVADKLDMDVVEAAVGIHDIVNNNMANALRIATVQRGLDPRQFTIVAFGGAGPMHAALLADQFGIEKIIVPASAGVFSAVGLLTSTLVVDYIHTDPKRARKPSSKVISKAYEDLETKARAELQAQGADLEQIEIRRSIDIRFVHQSHSLTLDLETSDITDHVVKSIENNFRVRYRQLYGIDMDHPVEIAHLRVRATGNVPSLRRQAGSKEPAQSLEPIDRREVNLGPYGRGLTPIYMRRRLKPGSPIRGPAVIHDDHTTIVVPPAYEFSKDEIGNLTMIR